MNLKSLLAQITRLPWSISGVAGDNSIMAREAGASDRVTVATVEGSEPNKVYVAHAANNYPNVVSELEGCILFLEAWAKNPKCTTANRLKAFADQAANARTVLNMTQEVPDLAEENSVQTGQTPGLKMPSAMNLEEKRRKAAEAEYQRFCDGALELNIMESDGWESIHNTWTCTYYIEDRENPQGPSIKCNFSVIFAPNSAQVVETASVD